MPDKKSAKLGKPVNLLDDLLRRRDEDRERIKNSIKLVDGVSLPVERNLMGLYRWYMHPALDNIALRNCLFWVQEIPPGSRSGKQKGQGGRIHLVLEGKGHTIIEGVRHDWEKGDMILIPLKPKGTEFQHFNDDTGNWAKFIAVEPNWCDPLGVDLGVGFEIVEPSPDYKNK